ncbi:MAG: hypothetical protein V2A53_04935 [bacterium]
MNWTKECYKEVEKDLQKERLIHALDTTDILHYIFAHRSPVTPILRTIFKCYAFFLLPGVIWGMLRVLTKIACIQKNMEEDFDYQRFIHCSTTKEFLNQKFKDPKSIVELYIKMERSHSFISFLSTTGSRGILGTPIQNLSYLIEERRLIPINEVINIEIGWKDGGIFEKIKRIYSSPYSHAISELNRIRSAHHKTLNHIDAFNLYLLCFLKEEHRNISFKMVGSSKTIVSLYKRMAPDIYSSPLHVFCYLKRKADDTKTDPFFSELEEMGFKPNDFLVDDLSEKYELADNLCHALQSKDSTHKLIEENGKRVKMERLMEGLIEKHSAGLLDYLIHDRHDWVLAMKDREKRRALKY